MVYQALYRKYRSQRFDEMIGQEVVATTLKNAIVNQQISHAYLFSGPRGTGKTSAAKIFAKAINCLHPENGEPDNTCEICQAITKGTLEDVIELDAASNNGVDEIREIRDKSTYAASLAHYKVYIIDEVHMLSTGAFNALLKTLEEPTPDVIFILATTELQKIPATIISRVQRFSFQSISTKDIHEHLADVLKDEKLDYEEAALDVIAKSAEGGMRDALSLLDQALSFSENKLKLSDALLVTGAISQEALVQYIRALSKGEVKEALTELDKIFSEGKNMLRFAEDLLAYFRDLLFADTTEIPHQRLYQWIDIVIDSLKTLRETTQTKIVADVMTMQLTETAEKSESDDDNRVEQETREIFELKNQIKSLQGQLTQSRETKVEPPMLERTPVLEELPVGRQSEPKVAKNNLISETKVDSDLIFMALDEAVNEPEIITQLRTVWLEVISNLKRPKNTALLKAAKLVAGSSSHLLLTVEQENLKNIIMADSALIDELKESLSLAVGFAPRSIVLTDEDWKQFRLEYTNRRKAKAQLGSSETESVELVVELMKEENEEKLKTNPQESSQETNLATSLFGDKAVFIDD